MSFCIFKQQRFRAEITILNSAGYNKVDIVIFDYAGKGIGDTALYDRETYEVMESYWPITIDKRTATRHNIEHSKWQR